MASSNATDEDGIGPEGGVERALVHGIALGLLARIGYLATRFFIPPFAVSHLGMEAYGVWATAFVLVSYLGISTFGLSIGYVRYVADGIARRDLEQANEVLSTGLAVAGSISVLLYAGIWLAWPSVSAWLEVGPALAPEARYVVLAVVAVFLADVSLGVFSGALTGAHRIGDTQVIWTISYLLEVVLIVSFVGSGRGLRGLADAFVIRTLVSIGLSALFAWRRLPWLRLSPGRVTRRALQRLLAFGGAVQGLGLLAIALNSIERVVAAPLLGVQAAGLLDLGKKLPSTAASLPSAFDSALAPSAAHLRGRGDELDPDGALAGLYLQSARYMGIVSGLLFAFLAGFAPSLLHVWLGTPEASLPLILCVFALATHLHLLTGPGTNLLKGAGRPWEELFYSGPNVALLAVLLPGVRGVQGTWTVEGIAIAVSAATAGSALVFLLRLHHVLAVPARVYLRRVFLPGLLPFPIAAAGGLLVGARLAASERWLAAAGVGLAGGVTAALAAGLLYALVLDPEERHWITSTLRRRLGLRDGGLVRARS
ncbi:hypothetical protein MYXO_03310 [Myxococcaceae bacterium]|nr:hypothetical protein MYXO_03310 [Myxococcaceae bacterium]